MFRRYGITTILLFILITQFSNIQAIIRPNSKIVAMANEGFIAYLEVAKSFGVIRNCWLQFADMEKVRIDLNATEPLITIHGALVLPFSTTICGIRMSKLATTSSGYWHLHIENIHGDYETDLVELTVLNAEPKSIETRIMRELGTGSISCSKHEYYTKRCKIVEAETGLSWPECQIQTEMRTNRTFDCYTYDLGRMPAGHEHITVDIMTSGAYANATQTETDAHFVLSCQMEDAPYYCYAQLPEQKQEFYINEGLNADSYTAYDTQLTKSRCSLEIMKPLQKQQIGLWRIFGERSSLGTGCLYYVGAAREQIIANELERLSAETRVIKEYAPVESSTTTTTTIKEISCLLPFSVDDCYIRNPNGTVHFPDKHEFRRTAPYGKCTFKNLPLIAGIWVCGARSASYDKEVLQDIEVIIKDKRGEVLTSSLKMKRSENVELMCRSAYEAPITRCVYVDPQDNVHLVASANSLKTLGHVHYYGRGLEYGECGIRINQINMEDFGLWRCQFGVVSLSSDTVFDIMLKESAVGQATSVGLGIGLTVMLVLIAGVIIGTIFYRRRNLSAQHTFTSADPLADYAHVENSGVATTATTSC